jgi:GNAT superfamily N-acetyltransferase
VRGVPRFFRSVGLRQNGRVIPTRDPRTQLRFATPADVPVILALIRGLAEYEKLAHEVVADEAQLQATLFGERRVAEVVIAEHEGKPAGFALFFHNYSTFLARPGIYLEDLFVMPELRGRGIGETLLAFLAKIAVERGCGRFEWSVLDWNEPALRFYRRLGAVPMDEWTVQRVTGDALAALAARF